MEIEPARRGADAVAPRSQHLPPRQAGRRRRQIPYRLLQRFLERHAHPTNIAAARPADPVRERERALAFERGPGLAAEHAFEFGLGGERMEERSEEHTSELQSLMRISYAVFCLKKKNKYMKPNTRTPRTDRQNL